MINLDGYVKNPWEKRAHDGIHVDVLINRIEANAHKGCGLHYEIFNQRCIDELFWVLEQLNQDDSDILIKAAAKRGYELDEISVIESHTAYIDCLKEIQQAQM
ncbi:hypothetical protein QE443_004699 [Pantoea ananatis]|uniref:hypothetical protein n=1 Tax=Pantoea ananas TaxID=553 RepID=UPI0027840D55|nr:hypothetical protein [Pantoea ananatis]MDQ1228438.1 hypothetical protein [Pantoea ananatis]